MMKKKFAFALLSTIALGAFSGPAFSSDDYAWTEFRKVSGSATSPYHVYAKYNCRNTIGGGVNCQFAGYITKINEAL